MGDNINMSKQKRTEKEERFEKVVEYNHNDDITGTTLMIVIPISVFIFLDIFSPYHELFIIGALLWALFFFMVAIVAIIFHRKVYWRKVK